MVVELLAQAVVFGLLLAGVYALAGSGLTLIFGVMRVINLAHGSLIVLSAYVAWYLFTRAGLDPLLSAVIAGPLLFLVGIFIYRYFLSGMPKGREGIAFSVMMTFGFALVIQNLLAYAFTGYFRTVNPSYAVQSFSVGNILFPVTKVLASTMSVVALACLFTFLWRTRTGTALRATIQNRDAAQLVGVNVQRISMFTFALGSLTAAAAGAVISIITGFYPSTGQIWIVRLLAIVVLGGLESMTGLLVAAIIMGVTESLTQVFISVSWSQLVFAAVIVAVLLLRPQGLFGEKEF